MTSSKARLIEKDILEDVGSTSAGSSEVIDLFGWPGGSDKFSCQAVYDVTTPAAKTFDSGEVEIDTFTFAAQSSTTGGDYMVVYDTAGLAWAAAADITGSDPEPTGAIWVAIPAERKTQVDLSGATTASTVATAFSTAINALAANPFLAAPSSATVVVTGDLRGPTTAPSVHNENDSGVGSIAVVVTNAGVASEVDVTENTVSIPSHSYPLGFKIRLTTTGTLPAGVTTGTDYFIIPVDDDTVQFASSLANALLGTAIDLTNQGSDGAVNTVTGVTLAGATVTFQKSNDGVNWVDVASATSITTDGSVMYEKENVSYRYFRAVKALTAGVVDLKALILVLGDAI